MVSSRIAPLDKNLGARIRGLRIQAKLTQPQVASHLGITYQSYQKMEGGKHSFRLTTVVALANLFQTSVDGLIEGVVLVDPVRSRCHYLVERLGESHLESAYLGLFRTVNGGRR